MQKLSHDGKFTITYDKAESNIQKVCLSTDKEISIWELGHAIYIDCICDTQIDADKLQCTIQTTKTKIEITFAKNYSMQETLSVICDHIKL